MKNSTRLVNIAEIGCDPARGEACDPAPVECLADPSAGETCAPPPPQSCDAEGVCIPLPTCAEGGICETVAEPSVFVIDEPAPARPSVGGSVLLIVSVLAAALGGCAG